jgi:hypothetical protein
MSEEFDSSFFERTKINMKTSKLKRKFAKLARFKFGCDTIFVAWIGGGSAPSSRRADECDVRKVKKIAKKAKRLIGPADGNVVNTKKDVKEIAAYGLSAATHAGIT